MYNEFGKGTLLVKVKCVDSIINVIGGPSKWLGECVEGLWLFLAYVKIKTDYI